MALLAWAVPAFLRVLQLDEESIKQIITYNESLTKDEASQNLRSILGDSPQAFEFISTFNSRRQAPQAASLPSSSQDNLQSEVPRTKTRHKKKQPFNKLPPVRQPDNLGNTDGGYIKGNDNDYISAKSKSSKEAPLAKALALKPDLAVTPNNVTQAGLAKLPPSAAGSLISDQKSSRSSSPAKAKVAIAGGLSMHGQSSTINDLDSAIRTLEIQTNPTFTHGADDKQRRCNCMATRHPLLKAAPNCLNCGKIICTKEGLGPCTFCGHQLLSSTDLQSMIKILREERGREKMEANNALHKRAEVSKTPRPFSNISTPPSSSVQSSDSESEKLVAAKKHRDKLLSYQAENARRTRIHDQASDFDTPSAGQSMWATPQERALQLKQQQKALREQEWNARPEYEKRRRVVSIDIVGGKAVKRMAAIERQDEVDSEDNEDHEPQIHNDARAGAFSRNPLLGALIRPVYPGIAKGETTTGERRTTWRRVQDDDNDNEQWILDGGTYGGHNEASELGDRVEERLCG